MIVASRLLSIVIALALTNEVLAQAPAIDGKRFAEISLRALTSVSPQDRRGARNMLAVQLASLPAGFRAEATDTLIDRLRADPEKTQGDVLSALGSTPTPWATANTLEDARFLYGLIKSTTDETTRTLADIALANAKGLYKDGIARFNTMSLQDLVESQSRLKVMAEQFPLSRYGERASFYYAQSFAKRFALDDPSGKALLTISNTMYEEYIAKAEGGDFARTDYLSAGYYFRSLNAWAAGNLDDARKWLTRGQQQFTDNDRIYIYQLFPSRDRATVIDKFLPAKSLFVNTLNFLNRVPPSPAGASNELVVILRQ